MREFVILLGLVGFYFCSGYFKVFCYQSFSTFCKLLASRSSCIFSYVKRLVRFFRSLLALFYELDFFFPNTVIWNATWYNHTLWNTFANPSREETAGSFLVSLLSSNEKICKWQNYLLLFNQCWLSFVRPMHCNDWSFLYHRSGLGSALKCALLCI